MRVVGIYIAVVSEIFPDALHDLGRGQVGQAKESEDAVDGAPLHVAAENIHTIKRLRIWNSVTNIKIKRDLQSAPKSHRIGDQSKGAQEYGARMGAAGQLRS